jgi:photosystem II cytochrome c550
MLKPILIFCALLAVVWNLITTPTLAKDLDEATRTVKFDSNSTIVLTPTELKNGKKLFNAACASCHSGEPPSPTPTSV